MNKILLIISYFIIFFNFNLSGKESSETLKVGVLAPLSGEYKELGNSLLYSLQLALEEINDKKVFIVPRDTGYKNSDKLNDAIKDFKSQGIKIVIGPISYEDFNEVKQYSGITFISPSNITPEFSSNIISIGISLESQMSALIKFLKKKKKSKTVIMIPQNNYTNLVEQKLKKLDLNN